jgi:hypothetical protein
MNQNERENQSDPELLIDIECTTEGFEVRVSRGGKVRYLDRGYKTRDDAWAAGRVFVKNWLRAQMQASGIARRGERPAFVGAAALEPKAIWVAPTDPIACQEALEGEQLCSCGHSDGVHLLGANTCAFEPCKCEEFTAALAVEAVQ